MKKNKNLKLTLIILIIILLALIAFVGIYVKNKVSYTNSMKEYLLSRDLKGYREVKIKVIEETEATEEDYKLSKEIIEKRLEKIGAIDYLVRESLEDGTIVIEIPENDDTDRILSRVIEKGNFEIVDADTNEVLMSNADIKSTKFGYSTGYNNQTAVILNIEFNDEGTEKFKNISNTYIKTGNETSTNTEETDEITENSEETTEKLITIKLNGQTVLTTYFQEEISNGILQLSLGNSSNLTAEELKDAYIESRDTSVVLDSGVLPLEYELDKSIYMGPIVTSAEISTIVVIAIAAIAILMIFTIIKYKTKGILASISLIGYIALLLIAVRIFNVEMSIAGIIAIVFSTIVYYAIIYMQLKEKNIYEVLKKFALILVPILIVSIVFTLNNIAFGPALFWGIVIALLYNVSITNWMIKE